MTDHDAIQRLIASYALFASNCDYISMAACYLEDGVWAVEGTAQSWTGHAAIVAKATAWSEKFEYVLQLVTPSVINVAGDTAQAWTLLRETSRYADCPRILEMFGQYADDLVRDGDGWKFARRSFRAMRFIEYDALQPMIFSRMKEWEG